MSIEERTGFRDEWISQWHRRRLPGFATLTDIDQVWVECDGIEPVAFVDFKKMRPRKMESGSLNMQARAADRCGVPFFVVFYNEIPEFVVRPSNARAGLLLRGDTDMNEREFIEFEYELRRVRRVA
jgi:hypothetical protein